MTPNKRYSPLTTTSLSDDDVPLSSPFLFRSMPILAQPPSAATLFGTRYSSGDGLDDDGKPRAVTTGTAPAKMAHVVPPIPPSASQQSRENGKDVSMLSDASGLTTTFPDDGTLPTVGWDSTTTAGLTRMGIYHPLETTHATLALSKLSQVLEALPQLFQRLSLRVLYQNSPIAATCFSMEQVEFHVGLWQSRGGGGADERLVLDIQRVKGDTVCFQRYARHILATIVALESTRTTTASGEETSTPVPGGTFHTPSVEAADRIWRNMESNHGNQKDNKSNSLTEAMEILHGLLKNDRYDARRLGMQSACLMTDPNKTGWSTALFVSKALLAPENHIQQSISHSILSWVLDDADQEQMMMDGSLNMYHRELSYLALQALAQALHVVAEATQLSLTTPVLVQHFLESTTAHSSRSEQDLVSTLLFRLRSVQESPHAAYFSIRALLALLVAVPSLRDRITLGDVHLAQQVGTATHAALASASEEFLQALAVLPSSASTPSSPSQTAAAPSSPFVPPPSC